MANLKEIRTRISSVKSTRQITSAMKMVAAARLKKSQDNILQLRPYASKLEEILANLSTSLVNDEERRSVFMQEREVKKVLVIMVSSNRGLCGAFNSNIVRKTLQHIEEHYAHLYRKGALDVISIGKKAMDIIKTKGIVTKEQHNHIFDDLNFETVSGLAQHFMDAFVEGRYDKIEIVYNQFKNAASQNLIVEQFLPVKVMSENDLHAKWSKQVDYILEPSQEYIIHELIPKSLKIQIFKALLDSYAAEQGARMTAMHKATDNATELIKDLTLQFNKARQAAITNEILEIVSGAEALRAG